MLQVIRDRVQGVIVWFIVGAIVVSFALFGINDYFSGNNRGTHAAVVNGKEISVYEYQVAYQNERARMEQMFGGQIDLDMMDQQIKNSALDRVIDNALMMQIALDEGFRISDQHVAEQIQAIDAFHDNGQFSQEMYTQKLRAAGETPAGFEQRIRHSLLTDQLMMGVAATGFATKVEIEQSYRVSKQQREISYFIVDRNKFKDSAKVAEADVVAFYEANKDKYMTPEMVSLEYLELTMDSAMAEVSVTEDDLKSAYDTQKARFTEPVQVKASHILIETGSDAAAAKAKAEALYARLQKGEDFAKLAKENSQDPGSADKGGDLGYFGAGIMDKAFEEASFALKVGELSKPVRSEFGYHLIKVSDRRGGQGKTFAEVRAQLENDLKRDRAKRIFVDKLDTFSTLAFEHPESLDALVDELKLPRKVTPMFPRQGGPGIAENRKVAEVAFSNAVLEDQLNSEVIEISDQSSVVVRVKERKPAEQRPLAQMRAMIEGQLKDKQASETAKAKAEALLAELKAGKKPADKEFSSFARKWIARDNQEANAELSRHLFAMGRPAADAANHDVVVMSGGDVAVVSLHGIRDGDVSAMTAEDKNTTTQQLENATAVADFTAFLAELKKKAEIERFPGNL
ncbi:MAG: SurA N-terminal domain-containing protein [Gammaproteobacteria bacterium]|nr:SurA N-terminal domain-containing protein [Gammaproteobacteria bacterium]